MHCICCSLHKKVTLTSALLSACESKTSSPVTSMSEPPFFSILNTLRRVFLMNSSKAVTTLHRFSRSITESVKFIRWDVLGRESRHANHTTDKIASSRQCGRGRNKTPTIIMAASENWSRNRLVEAECTRNSRTLSWLSVFLSRVIPVPFDPITVMSLGRPLVFVF